MVTTTIFQEGVTHADQYLHQSYPTRQPTPPDSNACAVLNPTNDVIGGPEGFDIFLKELSLLQVDVLGLSEHCLDTTKYRVLHSLQTTAARHSPGRVLLQLDSCSEPAIHQYKPGGTGIIAFRQVTSTLEPNGRGDDPLGRWSYLHLRRKNLSPLTIISAYQVCPTPTNVVGNTAFHQQQRYLNSSGRTGVHPRRAFQEDLGKFISTLITKRHDIILGGDFNESLTDRRSGIHHLATTYNLIDPFLIRHPHHPPFGTHIYGHRRIDLVLMTPGLLRSLQKSATHQSIILFPVTTGHFIWISVPVVSSVVPTSNFRSTPIELLEAQIRKLLRNSSPSCTKRFQVEELLSIGNH